MEGWAEMGHASGSEAYKSFVGRLSKVADNIMGPPQPRKPRRKAMPPWVDEELWGLIRKRKAKWGSLRAAIRNGESQEARRAHWEEFVALRKEVASAAHLKRKQCWDDFLVSLPQLEKSDPRAYWRKLNQIGKKAGSRGLGPVEDKEGNSTDPSSPAFASIWRDHFEAIGNEPSARQVDEETMAHHARVEALCASGTLFEDPASPCPELVSLNEPWTDEEIEVQLKAIPSGKAPGPDGWANDFLKVAFATNISLLTSLFNSVWEGEDISGEWQESLIAPLPKCADTSKTGNFRGISLMSCLGKLFGRVLNARLGKFLEAGGALMPEQGGFRATMECPEQGYALTECLRRRSVEGQETYVCFVDLRKAYDRVWREALWTKLHGLGVRGKALRVLRNWYARVVSAVRVNGTVTESFSIDLGVKQGCVLSPLLFNVFINDILVDTKARGGGAAVPGVFRTLFARALMTGLLWADDLAVLAGSETELKEVLADLTRWLDRWKMEANASKCAVLRVGSTQSQWEDRLAKVNEWRIDPAALPEPASPFELQGARVHAAEEFKYLGTLLSSSLSFSSEIARRVKKVKAVIFENEAIWRSHRLPVHLRLAAFKAKVWPVALWGAELWYTSAAEVAKLETAVGLGYRMLVGVNKLAASACIRWELGVPSVALLAERRRVNFFMKLRLREEKTERMWALALFRNEFTKKKKWAWQRHSRSLAREMGVAGAARVALESKVALDADGRAALLAAKASLPELTQQRAMRQMRAEAKNLKTLKLLIKVRDGEDYEIADYFGRLDDPEHWRMAFRVRTGSLPFNGRVAHFVDTPSGCLACASFDAGRVTFKTEKEDLLHFLTCEGLGRLAGPDTDTEREGWSLLDWQLHMKDTNYTAPRMRELAERWKKRCALNEAGLKKWKAWRTPPLCLTMGDATAASDDGAGVGQFLPDADVNNGRATSRGGVDRTGGTNTHQSGVEASLSV